MSPNIEDGGKLAPRTHLDLPLIYEMLQKEYSKFK